MTKTAKIYGKPGCQKCHAAQQKMEVLGIAFEVHDIRPMLEYHDGWRGDGAWEVLAAYHIYDQDLPIILMGREYLSYPQAMRRLKGRTDAGN